MNMNKDDYVYWTRKQFESLPRTSFDNHEIGTVSEIILLPCKTKHDSGFCNMEFVVVENGTPTYIIGSGSDVVLLGGISGVTLREISTYHLDKSIRWQFDCLPVSGLLRFWCNHNMRVGASVSTMEIFVESQK